MALGRLVAVVLAFLVAAGCQKIGFATQYEYDERVDLSLDGSAIVDVNASIAALVALHGAALDVDPEARFDRQAVSKLYEGPGTTVRDLSAYRRHGRRFAHVQIAVSDIHQLPKLPPLSWSRYRLERLDQEYRFVQEVGAPGDLNGPGAAVAFGSRARLPRVGPALEGPPVRGRIGDIGWSGDERVAFRVHLPSRINFHNSSANIERGNVLVWEQTLRERLSGTPLRMEARMETQSILYRTLWLFWGTFLAALALLAVIVWWVGRKGRSIVHA
jgi:hypothetical protein